MPSASPARAAWAKASSAPFGVVGDAGCVAGLVAGAIPAECFGDNGDVGGEVAGDVAGAGAPDTGGAARSLASVINPPAPQTTIDAASPAVTSFALADAIMCLTPYASGLAAMDEAPARTLLVDAADTVAVIFASKARETGSWPIAASIGA